MVIRVNIAWFMYTLVSACAPKIHTLKLVLCTHTFFSVYSAKFMFLFVCNHCLHYVVTAIACVLLLGHFVLNCVDVNLVTTSLTKVPHGVHLHQFFLLNLRKHQRLVKI
jgi:hypothetical protein